MDAANDTLTPPGFPIKIGKEMPPTRGASGMGEIDGGFPCHVVRER